MKLSLSQIAKAHAAAKGLLPSLTFVKIAAHTAARSSRLLARICTTKRQPPMNESELQMAAMTLRDRWRARIQIVDARLASPDLDDLERAVEVIERGVYEIVLFELVSRFDIPE